MFFSWLLLNIADNEGDKGGGGGFGSRFMTGKTAISHFTGKKLVISRNLMNSFLNCVNLIMPFLTRQPIFTF